MAPKKHLKADYDELSADALLVRQMLCREVCGSVFLRYLFDCMACFRYFSIICCVFDNNLSKNTIILFAINIDISVAIIGDNLFR